MGRYIACSHPCDSAWLLFVGWTSTASFALRGSAWTPGAGAFASGGCAAFWRKPPTEDNRRDEYYGHDGVLVSPNELE